MTKQAAIIVRTVFVYLSVFIGSASSRSWCIGNRGEKAGKTAKVLKEKHNNQNVIRSFLPGFSVFQCLIV